MEELENVLEELKIDALYTDVIDDIVEDAQDYESDSELENILARCDDILSNGCVSGVVSRLIYYSDTVAYYKEFEKEIEDLIIDLEEAGVEPLNVIKSKCSESEILMHADTVKNWIVWMCYEEITYRLQSALEELK